MNMKKGFTLIEVMIVVAIIAILAAVAIPNFIAYRENAQANACLSTVKQIENGAEAWSVQHPNDNSACTLADLWNETGTGFIKTKEEPKCAAGGTYTLKFNNTTKSYDVTCSAHEKNDDGGWVPKTAE